jgi:hypothetical protein
MITEVLNYFEGVLYNALVNETNDALRMALVQKRPFQEDPTRTAPYTVLTFDEEKGMIPDPDTPPEIGGPTYWKLFLKIKAAPKVQVNREEAYRLVGILAMRILYLLRQQYRSQPTFLNGGRMQNYNWLMVDKVITHVYGGEREWLSYADIRFFVRVVEPNPYGSYIGEV